MRMTAKIGRKSIKIVNSSINSALLIFILLLLVFACYAIWDSEQMHATASSANYTIYNPTVENETASFQDLQLINSDIFAWLTVYGTNIDYPVLHGQDNVRYVNTDAKGRHSLSGAIFVDHRSGPNFSDFSTIVYGHHMANQVMFGEIELFSDKAYFDARRYGMLFVDGDELGLEFFAFVHADAYDFDVFRTGITTQEEKQAYLNLLEQLSIHSRKDVSVTVNDRIILLSTCSSASTNGRDILIGRISANAHNNPFLTEERPAPKITIPTIDTLSNLLSGINMWMMIAIVVLTLIPLSLIILLLYSKRKHSHTTKETQRHA